MPPRQETFDKICEAIEGGATKKEIEKLTGFRTTTIERVLAILNDSGELHKETTADGKTFEYYLIRDPKELEKIEKRQRREKATGIRLTPDEQEVHRLLKGESMTVGELSRTLHKPTGVSKEYVYSILDNLQKKGFAVSVDEARKEATLDTSETLGRALEPLELEPLYQHRIKFAYVSDTHLGSKYQQLTLLKTSYKILNDEGVDFVIHLGDVVDGINMYRGQEQEIFLHGADDQRDYTTQHYPEGKGFKTYMISGSHDLSFKKIAGYNILEAVCKARPDLAYKGDIGAHTFKIKNLTFDVLHPSGGVPYAKSYRIQKIIEGALGDIIQRIRATKDVSTIPHFVAMGHLHIMCYTPHIGIKGFMVPCFQSQTPYLKAKGLMPEVGFIILNVECDDDWNINKITIDHHDLGAYVKEGDY